MPQLPIWFQAIKGASAVKSGIMNLPMILGLVLVSIVAGGAVSAVGYYTPFIYASVVLMSIGAGLLTTFKPNTGHAKWIGKPPREFTPVKDITELRFKLTWLTTSSLISFFSSTISTYR